VKWGGLIFPQKILLALNQESAEDSYALMEKVIVCGT
jgi:hypothetical protein